jgi:hypothetical protein
MQFTEEQRAFQDAVRKMVEKEVAPIATDLDESNRFPEELVEIFGDMGLLQLWVPEEYGGPGGDVTTVCIAREEVARVSLAASVLCGNNAVAMVLPLLHFGTEEQKKRFLPEAAKGRMITAIAITEPHAGSDVASIRTQAKRDGNAAYVINGQKSWITFGGRADYVLVFARTAEGTGYNGISAFLVDTKTPGFKVGRTERTMGRHGTPSTELFFENVRVPVENRVGDDGQGFKACMKTLDLNRPAIAASSVGLGQGALDAAVAFAKERKQFGQSIAQFQGIQFKIADMAMKLEAARNLVYCAAQEIDSGNHARIATISSMAKCFATDMAMEITVEAVQVLGSAGYSKDYPVERMMRDAKLNQIIEGTNEIHRMIIGRSLLR